MATAALTDVQRFVFSVRNNIGRPDIRNVFVTETVARTRDLRRNDQKEYDSVVQTYFKALESYQLTGGNPNEMACAITTLSILLQLELTSTQLLQCNSSIRVCLLSSNDFTTILAAARLLGESIRVSGPNDFVRKTVDDAMIWIGLTEARSETRRVGGLAVLAEVVEKVPVLFLKYLSDFFERIWTPLADPIPEVREGALIAFQAAIKVLSSRDKSSRIALFGTIYNKLRQVLSSKNVDQNISGLVVFECIILAAMEHSESPRYEDLLSILQPAIAVANSSSAPQTVRILMFRVFAVLCKFSPGDFVNNNLRGAVNYGLEFTKKDVERPAAFRMLSDIVQLVPPEKYDPFLDQTILAIKQVFIAQKRSNKPPVWEALECLAVICKKCPSKSVEAHVTSCIEHVFGNGLSTQLIECMREIVLASSNDAMLKLEESMLDLISITLCGMPFRLHKNETWASIEPTEEQIVIALDALLKFGFSNSEQLGDFLRDSVLPFLDSEAQAIRAAAIRTMGALLIPPTGSQDLTFSRRMCVDFVVTRLLIMGGSDHDPVIRRLIFCSLCSAQYFSLLCEPQFLYQVCNALGDEEPSCRVSVIELLCCMMPHNPSHILPVLRKEMIKNLQTIATTEQTHLLQQSLQVLSAVAQKAPSLSRAFHHNIFDVVAPRFLKAHQRTVYLESLLDCLTRVCQASTFCSVPAKDHDTQKDLIAKLIEFLLLFPVDKATQELRIRCVEMLTALLRPTHQGSSPYEVFPSLYKILSSIVRNKEECVEIRLEALRATGKIGALDPHHFASLAISDGSATNRMDAVVAMGKLTPKKFTRVVLQAMAGILDPSNPRVAGGNESVLRSAVKTILLICERSCSSHEELVAVFPSVCGMLQTIPGDARLFFTVLYELGNLILVCGPKSHNCLECFDSLAKALWSNTNARFLLVRICSSLAEILAGDGTMAQANAFGNHLSCFMPIMLDSLVQSDSDYYRKAVLHFLLKSERILQPFVHRITATFLEIIDNQKSNIDVCSSVVLVLRQLARTFPLQEMVAPTVRSLLTRLSLFMSTTVPVPTESNPFVVRTISLLKVLVVQQQGDFAPFAPDVLRCLKTLRLANHELIYMCTEACRGTRKIAMNVRSAAEMDEQVKELKDQFEASCARGLGEFGEIWGSSLKTPDVNDCEVDVVLPINEAVIVERCKQSTTGVKDEWLRWFEELCKAIIREAPYHIFRCIATSPGVNSPSLIDRSQEFVQDVLNVAFRSLYNNATIHLKNTLSDTFAKAMLSPTVPDDVVSTILSIAEYMDMIGAALSISGPKLAEVARNKGMMAKALYWQEACYRQNPQECAQDLIAIYGNLGQVASAVGLLQSETMQSSEDAQSSTQRQLNLIKLGRYAEALDLITRESNNVAFTSNNNTMVTSSLFDADSIFRASIATPQSTRRAQHPRTRSLSTVSDTENSFAYVQDPEVARKLEVEVRKIRCCSEVGDMHSVLAEWRLVLAKLGGQKPTEDDEENNLLNYIAPFAADAATRLKSWEDLNDAVPWIPKDTIAYGSALACLQISNQQFDAAERSVKQARLTLLEEITGLMHESYTRAYDGVVVAQQLVELEETIATLRLSSDQIQQQTQKQEISRVWSERISRSAQSIATWKRLLSSRSILVPPSEDVSTRILFVKMCRQYEGTSRLERFTLEQMLGCRSPTYDQLIDTCSNPRVVFEYISHLSACGELHRFGSLGDEKKIISKLLELHGHLPENRALVARMRARKGYGAEISEAIECYRGATECDPAWFRGWRFWAEANAKFLDQLTASSPTAATPIVTRGHVENAVRGFVKSIELAPSTANALQDVLKLLSFWSQHADTREGLAVLEQNVFDISLAVWQLVVPQLIARLDTGSDASCELVANILTAVAAEHPQSLIYPLNVCTASKVERRKKWANEILTKMENRFPKLVAQGRVVSKELIRLAGLVYEQWYELFENAAAAFFGRRNSTEMLEILIPAHETLKSPPQTLVEVEFHAKYSRLLEEAKNWLKSFSFTGKVADIHCAWNIYHTIYKQIDEQLKSSSVLSMQYCSPMLWEAKNLELTIPDTRSSRNWRETIRIAAFNDNLTVIASKQRPKRISILGTDGNHHKFLLKGHEDLRLDERVMQLFKLVNTLLLSNPHTSKVAGFQIQRYSVTPLWETVGLIGWVDECDTIHQLIHSHREERGIVPDLELKMIQNVITVDHAKAYDFLSIMSKVEVLEYLWDHTSGHDIRKAMWSSSLSCETWLERRKTFTTSLATMSVVGYILGLGDRHPNNIMIQRSTGKVVHIDFGDCFEVAMQRDRFPERVPFRLTRMLQNAMEVCGVDGNYRSSAETVMSVLRENKDSLIAMLGAFVQDPLISWRLVKRNVDDPAASNENKAIDEAMGVQHQDTDDVPLMALVPFSDDDEQSMMALRAKTDTASGDRKADEAEVAHQGVAIMQRMASKLRGQEFGGVTRRRGETRRIALDPKSQVSKLIAEATDISNIAQSWSGWYPFW